LVVLYDNYMSTKYYLPIVFIVIGVIAAIFYFSKDNNNVTKQIPEQAQNPDSNEQVEPDTTPEHGQVAVDRFKAPMSNHLARVTKKSFGTYVEPGNSPVSPERFRGYHAGTDFEILPGEENSEVPINAICDGKFVIKRTASGYGGLVAQQCEYDSIPTLVLYGHVVLSSVSHNIGDEIKAGEKIAILGQPGPDTDGERKHLHLGVRPGTDLVILGYVQNIKTLSDSYLDPLTVIK
jgi:murein DD-endopeptidase MepM/ murein hydrolase activator NlpD